MAERSRYRIEDEAQVEVKRISCINLAVDSYWETEYFDIIQ